MAQERSDELAGVVRTLDPAPLALYRASSATDLHPVSVLRRVPFEGGDEPEAAGVLFVHDGRLFGWGAVLPRARRRQGQSTPTADIAFIETYPAELPVPDG